MTIPWSIHHTYAAGRKKYRPLFLARPILVWHAQPFFDLALEEPVGKYVTFHGRFALEKPSNVIEQPLEHLHAKWVVSEVLDVLLARISAALDGTEVAADIRSEPFSFSQNDYLINVSTSVSFTPLIVSRPLALNNEGS